jgi:hypothetical protein
VLTSGSPQGSVCPLSSLIRLFRQRCHFLCEELQCSAIRRLSATFILYIDKCGLTNLAARVTENLARIYSWSERVDPIMLNNKMAQFSDIVKNLGLLIDRRRLSWSNQVSHVVSRTYATLRLLQRFSSQDLRIYLVRTLILPLFLYADVLLFRHCLVVSSGPHCLHKVCVLSKKV